ncbi:MAG TPA: ATP-binding protein [Candidatus Limnocylindrales bacterium]|nr:ATP-binding protein [Candidatus Limnocylindrales bacterium]
MSAVRRIFSVVVDGKTYTSLAYVLLRFPLALVYSGILAFIFFRGLENVFSLVLIIPAAMAIWGGVVTERAMATSWFGARLTPMAPERPPDRDWRRRVADVLSNPVTWKSLAFVAVEATVGLGAGLVVWTALLLGALGTISLAITFCVTVLVALVAGAQANVPPALPIVGLGGTLGCAVLLLGTLYVARWLARLQVWFVRVMLGMSETQAALAAARAEAAAEHQRAEVADRSRRDLVLNVSHELRNPLATIRAHVDTLRGDGRDEPSEDDRRRYLEVLNRETDRMASLVDELLTLASADTGTLHLDVGPVNPAEVATQVHDAMAPLAWRERHIQLLCNTDGAPSVLADRGRLAQVLMNLVRNAITHTPEGGLVAIEVKPLETGPVEVSVSDTGPGIAPEEKEKIFERFYRTDESRSRATGGFGLGLAIAREMVDAMGGRLSVDSVPGQGSRFTVTLARA